MGVEASQFGDDLLLELVGKCVSAFSLIVVCTRIVGEVVEDGTIDTEPERAMNNLQPFVQLAKRFPFFVKTGASISSDPLAFPSCAR